MVTVRAAVADDSRMLWRWRNDETARENSISTDEVPFDAHEAWYEGSLRSPSRRIYVGLDDDLDSIGMVRFDREHDHSVVSINLAPQARGRRLALPVLRAGIDRYRDDVGGALALVALIRDSNAPSLRLFTAAGFAPRDLVDGVWTYSRTD